jgi:hypothetical protein
MDDTKEVISKVLKGSKTRGQLKKIGMGDGKSMSSYKLVYDAPSAQLESIYFWLLDFLQDVSRDGVEKLVDNFTSSPGSGHFAEIGARATRMQEEGMKILGMINQVIKTVLNLVYDLKEFEIRLEHYKDAESTDKATKEAGLLSLKQVWLDQVDLKRGRGSIHQLAYEMGFTTLREAFLIANSVEDVSKMSKDEGILNEQVKRVLIPRVSEFLKWKDHSFRELQKRYDIEKSYLRTEVESLKLYTSWVKPYLKAAEELRQKGFDKNPALVNAFNTSMFQLTLLGKAKFDFVGGVKSKKLPEGFKNYNPKRQYYSCFLINLVFRGFPQKVTQEHYGFGGRIEISFDSYVLNDDEISVLKEELKKKDIEDGLSFVQDATDQSLEGLKDDINHFLGIEEEEKKEEKKQDDINPFAAIFGLFNKKKDEKGKGGKEITEAKQIKKDNYVESEMRRLAGETSKKIMYTIYDVYKKAHGMASTPEPFDS